MLADVDLCNSTDRCPTASASVYTLVVRHGGQTKNVKERLKRIIVEEMYLEESTLEKIGARAHTDSPWLEVPSGDSSRCIATSR